MWAVTAVVACSIAIRTIVSRHPHSGQGTPPLYGDYEAQRHWQEVTTNLPITKWYVHNNETNDLQYWGLDYPPLTAYHSWAVGSFANLINESYTELGTSRGIETADHKLFMRLTVLFCDIVIYLPAILYFVSSTGIRKGQRHVSAVALLVLYPGQILIDNGHFQYNDVSLGLFILAVGCIFKSRIYAATVLFSLAVNYKQMELYHALPIFFFILADCVRNCRFGRLLLVATTVLMTFGLVWAPFWISSDNPVDMTITILRRMFPIDRGLFEDKVANFWCISDVVWRARSRFDQANLVTISGIVTLCASLISNVHLCLRPTIDNLLFTLVNTSLAFYLFSFQVHEKSILLAAIPVAMLCIRHLNSRSVQSSLVVRLSIWMLFLSSVSMLPLLIKDGLVIAFVGTHAVFSLSTKYCSHSNPNSSQSLAETVCKWASRISYLISGGLIVPLYAVGNVQLPAIFGKTYPDLWPLGVSAFCFLHFGFFFIVFNLIQLAGVASSNKRKQE